MDFFIGIFQEKLTDARRIYRTAISITVRLLLIFRTCFSELLFPAADISIYIDIYNFNTTCPLGCHHNDFMATCALWARNVPIRMSCVPSADVTMKRLWGQVRGF